jgi:adenylate cyclase
MKKTFILSFLVSIIVFSLRISGGFEQLELLFTDLRVKAVRKTVKPPEEVSIILIDEASLKLMNNIVGRWPWPRSIHGSVIEFLRHGGAKAIVYDVLFTENERLWGLPSNKLSPGDSALVEETAIAGNVYHAVQIFRDIPDEWNKNLLDKPLPQDFQERFSLKALNLQKGSAEGNNYALPFKELYLSAKGIGVVEFSPDNDGIYRRTELIKCYHGACFPALGLSPFLNDFALEFVNEKKGALELHLKYRDGRETLLTIPYYKGKYLINLYGGFEAYSMSGVLASIQKIKKGEVENLPVNPEEFKDKVVFIGASAVGVEDLKPTSLAPRTPGVILHASLYGNMIKRDFIRTVPETLTPLFVFLISYLTALLIFSVRGFHRKIILSALPSLSFAFFSFLFFKLNILIEVSPPLSGGLLTYLGGFAYLSLTEEKEKRRIRNMFSRYVSTAVLSDIETRREDLVLSEVGRRMELTIFFSDLRGFTSLSESLPAERVVEVLNCYFTKAVDIIFKHNGTLDKFMGDAIMAFWGAPAIIENHALEAVLTALEIQKSLPEINAELIRRGLPQLKAGIGINTGEVVLGNIGSPQRLDYTVIGDNVNLASRLEGLTRFYGVSVLISEKTYKEINNRVPGRIIDIVRVKGKAEPVRIYEPFEDVKITLLFDEAFNYYVSRKWQEALKLYKEISRLLPDDQVAQIFVKRAELLLQEPPAEWSGIWEFKEK